MTDAALELRQRGNRAFAARDYDTAERYFRELIQTQPDSADGYLGVAKVLDRRHDHLGVVSLLEPSADQLNTSSVLKHLADAYRVLAQLGDRTKVLPAINRYEQYLQGRQDPVALFHLAELYGRQGDY